MLIKREMLKELEGHLAKQEISLVIGPRQAGKTTLLLLLKEALVKKGEGVLYLTMDNESDRPFFASQVALLKKLELELGRKRGFVFIDEIQRKGDAGLFLKGIYDRNLPYKFIVSGSGSLELKEKIHESLVGRKRIFELPPVSFREFVNFKTDDRHENKLDDFFEIERERTESLLEEYLRFGGYPKVVIESRGEEKRKVLDEIYSSYLEKDISSLLQVERPEAFSSLVKILAGQAGQLVNYSELSSTVGIALPTLKHYLWYGERTFVLVRLPPYFKNIRKEITKSPKIYFYDLGLRNYCLGFLGNEINPRERGSLFENFVFHILREKIRFTGASLHFWRTKDRAEVDFIVSAGERVIPVEVKDKKLEGPRIERATRGFIEKYRPEKALIVNRGYAGTVRVGKTGVTFLPFWKLFKEPL